jgi:hypothetical protein
MRRVLALAAALVVALSTAAVSETPPPRTQLRITGVGGQQAVLTVPEGGMRIDFPFFSTPRLPGPDGAVGGVLIQQLPSRTLVGGLLLQNVPGFDGALELGLVGFDGVQLPRGRYALTLLGTGPQSVALDLRQQASRTLKARGPARPVTRTTFGASPALHTWSDPVRVPAGQALVVLGSGAGGDHQQASLDQSCFRRAADDDGRCLPPDGSGVVASPGAGAAASWGSQFFSTDPEQAGDHVFSGRIAAVGPQSTAAHSTVLISLPR